MVSQRLNAWKNNPGLFRDLILRGNLRKHLIEGTVGKEHDSTQPHLLAWFVALTDPLDTTHRRFEEFLELVQLK